MSWRVGRGEAGELGKGQVVEGPFVSVSGFRLYLESHGGRGREQGGVFAEELQEARGELTFVVWKCCSGACCVRWAGGERVGRPDEGGGEAVTVTWEARVWVTSTRAATGAMERCGRLKRGLERRSSRTW